ncbi:UNVERIFIED_CONTAM: hypothetical protein PYX00_002694 [Menopon gallinae]|uniref:Aladin seven-bladed propeller domain-containing protein n=1 Tax=Menopon gallinae TaxID=328185 RepID=A0AAW2HXC2_9NEOP
MTSLDKFPPLPPQGRLTLCEVEGKIHSMDAEHANVNKYTSALNHHPRVSITSEVLHHAPTSREEAGRVFMPVTDIFFKRIVSAWYERGFLEAVKVAACLRPGEGPRFAVVLAEFVLRSVNVLSRITNKMYPCLRESGDKLIEAVSQTREWSVSPIRCIEWHPHATKLAVAAKDDSVRIYSTDTSLIPILKCKSQSNITSLAWRPFSSSELAVGCEAGVLLWTVDPNSVVSRPSMSCGVVLKQPGHRPVTSIVWAPQGDLILTASAADTSMYLWDVAMERNVALKRVGGGGVCLVTWSPDSSKLFASTAGVIFRVWKTEKWIPERWTVLSGRVQTACWSPCGSVVLFATTEEPVIYALPFDAFGSVFQSDDLCNANPVVDLTPIEVDDMEERIGGLVTSMCWDKRGHHLAVMFKESSVIAVFRTEIKSVFKITPCCFINGLLGEVPTSINFQKNFTEGAVLTIAWSTGRLQHFPFIYSDLELDQTSGFRPLSMSVNSPQSPRINL